jgi:hypothetical protein
MKLLPVGVNSWIALNLPREDLSNQDTFSSPISEKGEGRKTL